MDWNGHFWKGVFSEADGTPSLSRVATAVVVGVFSFKWITTTMDFNRSLPGIIDASLAIAAIYGLNCARNAATAIWGKPPEGK